MFLTIVVFYLPSGSNQKMVLSVSTLLALTWFILLLSEIIPPTSLHLPLLGRFLLFTMSLVALSIIISVIILNNHFKHSHCHQMPKWVRWFFLEQLSKIHWLFPMDLTKLNQVEPVFTDDNDNDNDQPDNGNGYGTSETPDHGRKGKKNKTSSVLAPLIWTPPVAMKLGRRNSKSPSMKRKSSKQSYLKRKKQVRFRLKDENKLAQASSEALLASLLVTQTEPLLEQYMHLPTVRYASRCIHYIALRAHELNVEEQFKAEWQAVASALDRIFLIIFSLTAFFGTLSIVAWAPALHDDTPAVHAEHHHVQMNQVQSLQTGEFLMN